MSWKPEVKVDGTWHQNALVFATEHEAKASAQDLHNRWMLVEEYRAVESSDPVNYTYINGKLEAVKNAR